MANDYLEYDPQVLEHLHRVQIEILSDLDAFCEVQRLKYFLHYGSLIGAIRHKGFIPWDDDIDVCMPREDLMRFIEAARADETFNQKYEIFMQPDRNYPSVCAKVSRRGTRLQSEEMIRSGISYGINIDIFPLDQVPKDSKEFERRAKKAYLISKLLYLYHLKGIHIPVKGIKGKVLSAACRIIHILLHLLPLDGGRRLQKMYLDNCRTKNPDDFYVDYYCSFGPATLKIGLDELETIRVPFENIQARIPVGYDRLLRSIFGDYMQLPPEEKRTNHAPEVIDFGEA